MKIFHLSTVNINLPLFLINYQKIPPEDEDESSENLEMNEFSNNQPENSHENENENVPVTENPDNENTDETNETLLPKSVNVEIHVE